jgi:hypothetical protein
VLDFTIPQGQGGTAGVSWQPVPMSPSASGANGDIAYDASFLYVKSASGWRRTAIASWTPLGAPTSVTAAPGNTQATVSWTAPVDNGGYSITDYAVQFSSNGGTSWTTFSDGTSTTTTATVTGLTNGTAYVFRVAAVNAVGTGPYSSATSSVTPGDGDPFFSSVSLLLHMDGSNGSTTFTDSSPVAATVTASSGTQISTTQSRFGGSSGRFLSASNYLTIPKSSVANFGTAEFTIEGFVWLQAERDDFGTIIGNYTSFGSGALLFAAGMAATPGKWTLSYDGVYPGISSTASVTYQQWTHFAIVRSGSTLSLYINGTSVGSASVTGANFDGTGTSFYVAASGDGLGNAGPNGYIDELRITKGVARYTANFTPPTAAFPDA